MAFRFSQLPEQDSIAKGFSVLQLICFIALFLGIYLPLRKIVHALPLRILILIGDYIIVSLVTFLVIRPLAMHAEAAYRKKRK